MTSKAQERKALEQIRKIVETLGEDSYIATAFDGCFEIAEENIENDFACSLKERCEIAEENAEKKCAMLFEENEKLRKDLEDANEAFRIEQKDNELTGKWLREAAACRDQWIEEAGKAEAKAEKAEAKVAELESEIINLKAKLYDMMMAAQDKA